MQVLVAGVGELQCVGRAEGPECSLAPLEDGRSAYRGELGGALDQAGGDQDVDTFLGWLGDTFYATVAVIIPVYFLAVAVRSAALDQSPSSTVGCAATPGCP